MIESRKNIIYDDAHNITFFTKVSQVPKAKYQYLFLSELLEILNSLNLNRKLKSKRISEC